MTATLRPMPRRLPARTPETATWKIVTLLLIFGIGGVVILIQTIEALRQPPRPPETAQPSPARSQAVKDSLTAASAPAAAPRAWWKGGRLHNVSLLTWRGATPENKLATAADWLSSTKWKGHLNTPADLVRIRAAAERLVSAVDVVAENPKLDYQNTGEIAAAIIVFANDMGP